MRKAKEVRSVAKITVSVTVEALVLDAKLTMLSALTESIKSQIRLSTEKGR